jgi:DNA/RNA endonuclease YhcR with UshA esterase domain
MRLLAYCIISLSISTLTPLCSAVCLPISEAQNHIGETRCVTGKIIKVAEGDKGVHYLDFCDNHETCPFTVVIFASDLRYIGDVRQLAGKIVEIHGPVKMYDNHAEIVLSNMRQLKGEGTQIPPLPKDFDVERKGRYSAGKFAHPKSPRQTSRKRQSKPVPQTDPSETDSPLD